MTVAGTRTRPRGSPARAAAALLLLATLGIACGGDGGGGVTPIVASFEPSGTPPSPDFVRLTGTASGDVVIVNVVITGPTTSSGLVSFAFDLVLFDATVARYVAGSATAGSALTATPGHPIQVLAVQTGDRVSVGVTKLGDAAGNGIGDTTVTIVSLRFEVLRRAATNIALAGSPPNAPAALDETGTPIASVRFDSSPASIWGS